MRFLIGILLKALAFGFLLPMIPGIHFHGSIVVAIGLAIFFGIIQFVVEAIAVAVSAYMTISTLGLALVVLLPLWILGFWLLPAVALKWVADLMPQYLALSGWVPAILGGLVLLVIGTITSDVGKLRRSETV